MTYRFAVPFTWTDGTGRKTEFAKGATVSAGEWAEMLTDLTGAGLVGPGKPVRPVPVEAAPDTTTEG